MKKILLCGLILFAGVAAAVWRGPDVAGMDPAIKPGVDFFNYANGGWIPITVAQRWLM